MGQEYEEVKKNMVKVIDELQKALDDAKTVEESNLIAAQVFLLRWDFVGNLITVFAQQDSMTTDDWWELSSEFELISMVCSRAGLSISDKPHAEVEA